MGAGVHALTARAVALPDPWPDLVREVQLNAPINVDGLGWRPEEIILTAGCDTRPHEAVHCERILAAFPDARVTDARHLPHNRIRLPGESPLDRLNRGKRTLVLGAIRKPVSRNCDPEASAGTLCTSYHAVHPAWFCFYNCAYCYLSGSPGVRFSPTVRLFTNLHDILAHMQAALARSRDTVSFYVGKVQDGLQLDPLGNFSRILVPFVQDHAYAHLVFLTKSDCVDGPIAAARQQQGVVAGEGERGAVESAVVRGGPDPGRGGEGGERGAGACVGERGGVAGDGGRDCRWPQGSPASRPSAASTGAPAPVGGNVAVSWSLSPPEVARELEWGAPSFERRLAAARRCAEAGLEVRFIFMPLVPIPDWKGAYAAAIACALATVTPSRITLGGICSYPVALADTRARLGEGNLISREATAKHGRRMRYEPAVRDELYRHLIALVHRLAPGVPVSLCLETAAAWHSAGLDAHECRCNCIAGACDLLA